MGWVNVLLQDPADLVAAIVIMVVGLIAIALVLFANPLTTPFEKKV
jgi:uncharacterized protein (DUF983 family)